MKILFRIIILLVIAGIIAGVLFRVMKPRDAVTQNAYKEPVAVIPPTTDIPGQKCGPLPAISIATIHEQASTSPSVSVEYPQFPSLSLQLNQAIKSAVLDRLAEFRKNADDNLKARKATASPGEAVSASDFSFQSSFEAAQKNASYVSLILRFDSYVGGANENQELQTVNYDVKNNRLLDLKGLYGGTPNYLILISTDVREQLTKALKSAGGENASLSMMTAGTDPDAENFANFTFTDKALEIYFPKYSVAAGTFGEQHVTIPFTLIEPSLENVTKSCETN